MLFFTQCFGAVLDLIHLRFQHNKAKRVFSAAGQLVCVVNPTHNLKVSVWLPFDVPAAGVQVLPRGARRGGGVSDPPTEPGSSRQRSPLCYTRRCWVPCWVLLLLPGCGCSRDAVVCFPAWQGRLEAASISFPHAVKPRSRGWGAVSEVRVLRGARGVPLPLPNIWGQVVRREGLRSYPHCRLSRVLARQAGKHTDF